MRLLYGGASAAVAVATTVISYLPFWDGWDTFGYLSQVGNKTGFTIASLLGGYLNGNLGLPRGGAIFILALPLAAYLAWKAWRVRELEDFVSGAAVIAFFVPLMMFWFQPWYLVLALGLLALRPRGPLYIAAIVFSMSVIFYDSFWWQAPIRMDVQKVLRVLIVFGPPLALLLVLKARHLIPDAWRRTVAWSLQEPGAGEGGEGAARLSAARMTLEMAALVSAAAVPIAVTVSSSPQLRSFVDLVIFKLRLLYPF